MIIIYILFLISLYNKRNGNNKITYNIYYYYFLLNNISKYYTYYFKL